MAQNKSLQIKDQIWLRLKKKLFSTGNLTSNIDMFERLRTGIFLGIRRDVRISIEKSETHII